jgi:hypothetical protein
MINEGAGAMKTKTNYPFIYFFAEPNVVFVYKIEGEEYLTVSDLSQRGEWQTYEIKNEDEFETFNHEAHVALVGRGYFLQRDQYHFMAGKINQLIQSRRNIIQRDRGMEVPTVHLVSSPSTVGSLRVGLDSPKKVIGFQDPFSIGPIWKLESKIGQAYRYEWLYENINFEQDDYELENRFTNTLLEIADIPDHLPIYIWVANNGNEQTGLRLILYLLKDKTNEITVINTTDLADYWMTPYDSKQSMFHSSMLRPPQLKLLFEHISVEKTLSQQERIQYQKEWESLAQSKDVLRVWQKGRVTSVPEDYYDSFILKTIEQTHQKQESMDFIRAGRVVGEILHQIDEIVGDVYFEYRLRHLIYNGVLELKGIPKSMRHYSVKLRV